MYLNEKNELVVSLEEFKDRCDTQTYYVGGSLLLYVVCDIDPHSFGGVSAIVILDGSTQVAKTHCRFLRYSGRWVVVHNSFDNSAATMIDKGLSYVDRTLTELVEILRDDTILKWLELKSHNEKD